MISGTVPKYLLAGLAIREVLSFWTGHTYDFEIWVRLGIYMQHLVTPYTTLPYVLGLSFAAYALTGSISYPPFSAFIFAGIYKLYLSTGIASRFLYYFLLKQPMVLSDLGAGLVLARIAFDHLGVYRAYSAWKPWWCFLSRLVVSMDWWSFDRIR